MKRFLLTLVMVVLASLVLPVHAQDCDPEETCVAAITVYGLSEAEILAYAGPDLGELTVDSKLLHDRAYKQVIGVMNVYDAPNGNLIRTLPEGFNYMTSINSVEGWVEINPGEWVKAEQLKNVNYVVSQFTGVLLPEEALQYPIAWLLINLYPAIEPGGEPNETVNTLLPRYTLVNLFATVELDGWNWYQIGVNQWVQQTQVAKYHPTERPEGVTTERWVSIDLYEQTLVAYEGDTPVFTTLIASGLPRWPTREGIFNIFWRRTREDMSWGTPGDDFYYLEEVPHTMFFDEGRALHGAYWHDGFGYRRSHGCVNMSITDAHWLFEWVAEYMGSRTSPDVEEGPNVYVYSSGTYIE